MISVYRKHRYRDIDIGIFIVDIVERPTPHPSAPSSICLLLEPHLPLKVLTRITKHFQLARLLPIAIHPQRPHDLIHRLSRRLVVVEEIASQQDHVHVSLPRQAHDLVKAFPAVVAADGVSLVEPDMTVCCYEDADGVRGYSGDLVRISGIDVMVRIVKLPAAPVGLSIPYLSGRA